MRNEGQLVKAYLDPSTVVDMSNPDYVFFYARQVDVEVLERGEVFGEGLVDVRHGRPESDVCLMLVLLRLCAR